MRVAPFLETTWPTFVPAADIAVRAVVRAAILEADATIADVSYRMSRRAPREEAIEGLNVYALVAPRPWWEQMFHWYDKWLLAAIVFFGLFWPTFLEDAWFQVSNHVLRWIELVQR